MPDRLIARVLAVLGTYLQTYWYGWFPPVTALTSKLVATTGSSYYITDRLIARCLVASCLSYKPCCETSWYDWFFLLRHLPPDSKGSRIVYKWWVRGFPLEGHGSNFTYLIERLRLLCIRAFEPSAVRVSVLPPSLEEAVLPAPPQRPTRAKKYPSAGMTPTRG